MGLYGPLNILLNSVSEASHNLVTRQYWVIMLRANKEGSGFSRQNALKTKRGENTKSENIKAITGK